MSKIDELARLIRQRNKPATDNVSTGTIQGNSILVNGVNHRLETTVDMPLDDGDRVKVRFDRWGRAVVIGK